MSEDSVMKICRMALTALGTALSAGLAIGLAQQVDVDRELEEAKALYREAKFAQAVAKLQGTIVRLEQLRDLQARKIQLSDAHLHLALSYVALNDPAAAKESLKHMLRADRNRKLDPDVYAPKVIELFEEAKKEVVAEPVGAAPPPPSATAKKGGSKAPLILLGAAAAAGGGIAAAKGGGGTGSSAVPTPTATPTPTPAVVGSQDIVLLQLDPPSGSTISLVSLRPVRFTVSVVNDTAGTYHLFAGIDPRGYQGSDSCVIGQSETFTLTPGQARTISMSITPDPQKSQTPPCMAPFTTSVLTVDLQFDPFTGRSGVRRAFAVQYAFVP